MKILKKNQIIVYAIVLMLMVAGYLNYTGNTQKQLSVETAMQTEAKDDMQLADIGDAALVSSNDVVTASDENTQTTATNTAENTINTSSIDTNENTINSNNMATATDNTNSANTVETATNNTNDYFVKSKLERDTMYSQMIETYEKVLNSTSSSETQKQTATQEIQKINETKNSIMICENLIKTKGFENSVIFVNSESISIVIGTVEIKQEEVAQIQNIISREMKAEPENIHISIK